MNTPFRKFTASLLIVLTMLLPFRVMAMQSAVSDDCAKMEHAAMSTMAMEDHETMCSDCQQAGCAEHDNCANDGCHSCGHFASALPMVFVAPIDFIPESHHTAAKSGELLNQVFPLLRPPRV